MKRKYCNKSVMRCKHQALYESEWWKAFKRRANINSEKQRVERIEFMTKANLNKDQSFES